MNQIGGYPQLFPKAKWRGMILNRHPCLSISLSGFSMIFSCDNGVSRCCRGACPFCRRSNVDPFDDYTDANVRTESAPSVESASTAAGGLWRFVSAGAKLYIHCVLSNISARFYRRNTINSWQWKLSRTYRIKGYNDFPLKNVENKNRRTELNQAMLGTTVGLFSTVLSRERISMGETVIHTLVGIGTRVEIPKRRARATPNQTRSYGCSCCCASLGPWCVDDHARSRGRRKHCSYRGDTPNG